MEYLAGGTVADALRLHAVDREQAMRWLREAAAAIDYAHSHGVLHRDIKLANLLLDSDRVLHVADFGIARVGSEETITSTGQVMGTAAYLAPERALGRPATPASDRYALAVAAFELLVGERPFTAEHFAAQARQHVDEAPPAASGRNPSLPRELDAVLARGMAKRPEDRWPSAGGFVEALTSALQPATARSAPDDTTPVMQSVVGRRRPRALAIAALAATALCVGMVIGATNQGTRSHPHVVASARPASSSPAPVHAAHAPKRQRSTASGPTTIPPPRTQSLSADALDARGHALMLAGDYPAAIPVLRRAIATASPDSLTYAYALFDLGRSLRLGGDPRAAVPILWRRLQIPDQTGVVRLELQLALQAIGAQERALPGPSPAPTGPAGHDHGGGRGHGNGGGKNEGD
jgi:serine/threonine-protein kinase